ncbi:MAG: hypothetical protein LBK69_05040 [Syntrophomonadaceae bacterium]|jgi:hypothetical protein|nr:hypothetical protein [Syntrophomonadaceae bacterium]
MTSRFLWASLLLIFLTVLSACAPEADKNVPEENAAELSEPATPEEEAGPDPEAPDSEETLRALAEAFSLEEKLSLFMTPYTSIELDTFRYGDFDRDGVHEAFAVKHIDNHDLRFERLGVLIFIRPDGCTVLEMLEQTGYRSFKH